MLSNMPIIAIKDQCRGPQVFEVRRDILAQMILQRCAYGPRSVGRPCQERRDGQSYARKSVLKKTKRRAEACCCRGGCAGERGRGEGVVKRRKRESNRLCFQMLAHLRLCPTP